MAVSAAVAVSSKMVKLVTGTDKHTVDLIDDPFASDVEEDEIDIEDD